MTGPAAAVRPVSGLRIAAALLAAVALAAGWILFSLVAGKAGLGKALTAQSMGQASLAQTVTRTGLTKSGTKVQVLFATPEYFERTGQTESAAEIGAEKYLTFMVTEENHDTLKPAPLPTIMSGSQRVAIPVKDRLLSSSDHHRTRMLRYPKAGPNGESYLPEGTRSIALMWPDMELIHTADHQETSPLNWAWPLALPSDTAGRAPLTPGTFLVLTAGLFAALSPCLIQLTLYYLSSLAGASAAPQTGRRRILRTAGMFVAGISAAYTIGGALAGYLGRAIQVNSVVGEYGRWVAIVSGLFIVAMGLKSVVESNAPMVCRMNLPGSGPLARWKTGPAGPFLMGFLMSLGCLQCFGGALFGSLLVYVGSLGSPATGALMLFLFSLGVGLPFLGAALAWDRVTGWLASVGRAMQYVSLTGGVVMMAFGILMVTDKFHWISSSLLRLMPFLQV